MPNDMDVKPVQGFSLRELGLLDAPPQPAYDNIVRLTAQMVGVPISYVSILDNARDRQFFKSQIGLPEPWASARQTPLSHSFCRHVITEDAPMVVDDARKHSVVRDNPAVGALGVVAYIGMPIHSPEGDPVGTLCAVDSVPRCWNEEEISRVRALAACVTDVIGLHAEVIAAERARQVAQAAEQRNRFMAEVFEQIPWGLILFDEGGHLRFFNSAYADMFPEARAALAPGIHIRDLLVTIAGSGQLDLGGLTPEEWGDYSARGEDPKLFYATDVPLKNGRINERTRARLANGWQIFQLHDVTEIRAQERALRESFDDLRITHENLERFSRAAAHDLKTPLRSIETLLEVLREDFGPAMDADALDLVSTAQRAAERMQTLIVDLLDHAKCGARSMRRETLDLDELVRELWKDLADEADNESSTLAVTGPLGSVHGDRTLVYLLLQNLLGNAIKYRDPGRPLSLQISRQMKDGADALLVSDNGLGFDQRFASRIFEPFERLYGASEIEGSGIGLATCAAICARHGWQIDAQGEAGVGATFRIRLT